MKRQIGHFLLFFILISFPVVFEGCKKIEDGLSDLKWQIDFDLVKTTWDVQFYDASTGMPLGVNSDLRVEVTITGSDKSNILDLAGIRQTRFYSTQGTLALALHPDRTSPDAQTPVSFVIHASQRDYIPVQVPVLTYHEGINPIRIYMVNRSVAAENVDHVYMTDAARLVFGKLSDTVSLKTPAGLASFQMNAGTELSGSGNSQLTPGDLFITLSCWEGSTTNGLKSFPGGQIVVDAAGNPGLVYPACGLFIDIQDQNLLSVSTISKPIQCQAVISPAVYNPVSAAFIAAGEEVPLWFMNESSGIWENQGPVTVEASGALLVANITLSRPGMYMLGWINTNLHSAPLQFHPVFAPGGDPLSYAFTVNIYEMLGHELRFVRTAAVNGPATEDFNLHFLPSNSELVIRFESFMGEDRAYYSNPDPVLISGGYNFSTPVNLNLVPKSGCTCKKIEIILVDIN
ncbi:MAG: hypothetical protein PHY99_08315, partial [Bacteroidales bacterium]|nr:hypothetical protein [Bacteroidales bacterium]